MLLRARPPRPTSCARRSQQKLPEVADTYRAPRQPLLRRAPTPAGSSEFSLTYCYRDFKAYST
ncbi:hypothetical protein A2U01_0071213, partial [Trifolium medium]|nr:hypothetical protein [Trifolium medium]